MIYFIEAVGAGLVKIGFTERDAESRMRELQTASPHRLRLLTTMSGTASDEAELHAALAHLRVSGEWFRDEGELRLLRWFAARVFGSQQRWRQESEATFARIREWMRLADLRHAALHEQIYPESEAGEPSAIESLAGQMDVQDYEAGELRRRIERVERRVVQLMGLGGDEAVESRRSLSADCRM